MLLTWDRVSAQPITIANPNWHITHSDFGYSDFLLDHTPGFQGREYLSGESMGSQITDIHLQFLIIPLDSAA